MDKYLSEKNIFINPKYVNKTIIVKPKSKMTIKNIIQIAKNMYGKYSKNDINILIKTNLNGLNKSFVILKKANL